MKPTPLTPLEEFFFHDDRPTHPCWIMANFHLRGALRRDALAAAWIATVTRHEHLRAIVGRGRFGKLTWRPVPRDAWPGCVWLDAPPLGDWPPWSRVDLMQRPGVRLFAWTHGDHTAVVLQFHHAVADGAGHLQVFHELLIHYARACGVAVALPDLRPEMLGRHHRLGTTWRDRLRRLPALVRGLRGARVLLRHRAVPLRPPSPAGDAAPAPQGFPAIVSRRLAPDALSRLRAAAKRLGVSIHEFLVRDLQAALGLWRRAHGLTDDGGWIRLGIPVNLRRSVDRFLPAANMIGVVILDRREGALADRAGLLRAAATDMERVKRDRLGHVFPVMLALACRLPGGLRARAARPDCQATALLTNLGQIYARSPLHDAHRRLAVPGAVLEDIVMTAPCRPLTGATLAVGLYSGRLLLDLHFDPRLLSHAEAGALQDTLIDQLTRSATEP